MAADKKNANLQAMLERARQLLHEKHLDDADAIFARVVEQYPMQADALIGRARVALNKGSPADAADFLRSVLVNQPDHVEACFGLAVVSQSQGHLDEAANWYERTTQLRPGDSAAFYNLGIVRHEQGRLAEAEAAYRGACDSNGGFFQAFNNLGNILLAQGRLGEAMDAYRGALRSQPNLLQALHGIGLVQQRQGQTDAAEGSFRQVLELSPDYSPVFISMGSIHQQRGESSEAIEWYRRTLQAHPDDVDAHFNLGRVYQDLKRFAVAEQMYREALTLKQRQAAIGAHEVGDDELYYSLSLVLRKQGKWEAWFENLEQFAQARPGSLLLALDGVIASRYLADAERERRCLGELLEHRYAAQETSALRTVLGLLSYFDLQQEQALSVYRQFDVLSRLRVARWAALALPERTHGSKIRVGYLSADLRRHVMGHMMWEVISRHDAENFEIFCYSLSRIEDDLTRNFRGRCNKYTVVAGLTPRAAAELIAADALDILVDLVTHTEGAEPDILAFKPARVQITHIANSDAVGLSAIDYKLTDGYCDPPENQKGLLETLLPMAGCVYPYRHLPPATTHDYSLQQLGIAGDVIVFGAFMSLLKLGPRCLSLWKRVMERLPRSVLAFSPNKEHEVPAYRFLMKSAGIAADRFLFIPNSKDEATARARYDLVDMVLDTLPCSGVNGTLEALDMGVPVVTLLGDRHCERTSYSILSNLGVEMTIARSEDEYVAIAVRLAEDGAFRSEVQDAIRRGLRDSPLVNMAAHVAHLEDAYRQALANKGIL